MIKLKLLGVCLLCSSLSACIGNLFTGANLFYDRHHVYKKTTDMALSAQMGHSLKLDPMLDCPSNRCFELTVFHNDVLLLGEVPSDAQKQRAIAVVQAVGGYRQMYTYITVTPNVSQTEAFSDSWITTQIRSKIVANSDIDPAPFKVITYHNIVYLLGDVMDGQDKLIIDIARNTQNVDKVVNLLHVYMLKPKNKPMAAPIPSFPIPNNNGF